VAIVVFAAGVPTTLLEERVGIISGAVVLAACLWLVAASRARLGRGNLRALGVGGAVVLLAAVAAGGTGAPSGAAVDWKDWQLYARVRGQVGLGYVWEAHYDGIRFPEKKTTVLRVRGSDRAAYWRASTLDVFDGTRWREYLYAVSVGLPRGRLPVDPLLPATANDERRWVRQQVEIAALRSNRLPAAGSPVSLVSSSFPQVAYLGGGVIGYGAGLTPGQRYTVWSYAPRPRPQQLAASPPRYPRNVDRYLTLSGAQLPVFGSSSHDAVVDERLGPPYHEDLVPYRAVWDVARRVTRSETTPYGVTLALERWFRSRGGFVYDEEPPRPQGAPPLADFVLRTKRGYCQHFAGSMAMMLRLLGIPARVAVGFTSGSLRDGVWTVTDHEAHAWVEAWFNGWGWLPFDPTPGRGAFSQTYTVASNSADAVLRLGGRPFVPQGAAPAGPGAIGADEGRGGSVWPLALLGAIVGCLVSLGLVKSAQRRWRYRSGDPRAIASAARAELADRLTDQGVRLPARPTIPDVTRGLRAVGLNGTSFALAAARARYGPAAGAAAAAADTRRELRSLVRALRASLPAHRRLRGHVSLRSLRRA
jgi:transglutaminase-like putative cysteine protease